MSASNPLRVVLVVGGWVVIAAGAWFTWLALSPFLDLFTSGGADEANMDDLLAEAMVPGVVALVLLTVGGVLVAMSQSATVRVKVEAAQAPVSVKVRCPSCQVLAPEDSTFCPACGSAL